MLRTKPLIKTGRGEMLRLFDWGKYEGINTSRTPRTEETDC